MLEPDTGNTDPSPMPGITPEKVPLVPEVYEWESELDEYDEPDCYPCEKDYKWVDELVSCSDSDDENKLERAVGEGDPITPADGGKSREEEQEEEKPETDEKPDGQALAAGGFLGISGEDEEEEMVIITEPDEDKKEPEKKKKYKTIQVRKLIERGPKIHYDPEEQTITGISNREEVFPEPPFRIIRSFGYDCQRHANLHLLDENTLMFMSGFLLTFLDIQTGEQTYHRCIGGSCFGALHIHPSRKLFAAGEKGIDPVIGIWSWPKLQLFRKLCGGTDSAYASVNFSPNGTLLASQGADPDFLITVWNWLGEVPVLRVKSHAQDVYRVRFSSELVGNLTTSGLTHIKFWKMASTFTGLKLKGNLGRFGKTELSDIESYAGMADGKVVSGSEWGNLLVWENGLVVAEICTLGDRTCHKGIIRQVFLHDGDFLTSGQDGYVRVWNQEAIDTSEINTTEHSNKVPLRSMAEVLIHENADIWTLVNDLPNIYGETSNMWYAQDGKGIIWRVDLCFLHTAEEPQKIFTSHGGAIIGCQTSQSDPLIATLCRFGEIRVTDYNENKLVASRKFGCAGSCLFWPNVYFHDRCNTLVAGFEDGTLRILLLSAFGDETKGLPMSIVLESVCKPHSRKITSIAMHQTGDMMATSSLDGTIFFYNARNAFAPLSFFSMDGYVPVIHMTFTYESFNITKKRVVAVLEGAVLIEIEAPVQEKVDNSVSYFDPNITVLRKFEFESVKSKIMHDEQIERENFEIDQRQREADKKNLELVESGQESQEDQNARLLVEAEKFEEEQRLLQEERKKWQPYIPPEPSPITLLIQNPLNSNDWIISMGKYDCGFLYSVQLKTEAEIKKLGSKAKHPSLSVKIPEINEETLNVLKFMPTGEGLLMGFENGKIRFQKLSSSFEIDCMDAYWSEGIHDCVRGSITALCLDNDAQFLFSTGLDGNCFMFGLGKEKPIKPLDFKDFPDVTQKVDVIDNVDKDSPTLELFKNQAKQLALLAEAKKKKATKRERLSQIRLWFSELVKRNKELPPKEQLSAIEFCITDNEQRKQENFEIAKAELEKVMAWESERCRLSLEKMQKYYRSPVHSDMFILKSFRSKIVLSSFRIPKYPTFFETAKERAIRESSPTLADTEYSDEEDDDTVEFDTGLPPKPKFIRGMDKFQFQGRLRRWRKKKQRADRKVVWHEFEKTRPTEKHLQEEERLITSAKENMGYMKLKTSEEFMNDKKNKITTNRIRRALITLEEIMFDLKDSFNKQMKLLRQYKIIHISRMRKYELKLLECQEDLDHELHEDIPFIPQMTLAEDPDAISRYTQEDVLDFRDSILKKGPRFNPNQGKSKPAPKRLPRRSTFHKQDHVETTEKKKEEKDIGSYVEIPETESSCLEDEIEQTKYIKAKFYQSHYIALIENEMFSFDAKLKILRHKKMRLDCVLKVAETRMTLLTQEFLLVGASEERVFAAETIMTKLNKEKKECQSELKILNKKIENLKKSFEEYHKQKMVLFAEVVAIAKEGAPQFEKYLVRVYKKKFVRPKQRSEESTDGTEDDSDGSDSSSSDDDMDLEDDDDDDGLDIDMPPDELGEQIYLAVINIRTRKHTLDMEEEITNGHYLEITQASNALKARITVIEKEYDANLKQLKAIKKAQSEKQNDLDFAVVVKLHQIYHMADTLKEALVTEKSTIKKLHRRIPELHKEKANEAAGVHVNKREHRVLQISKKKFLQRLDDKDAHCDEEMVKKFGQTVDLVVLENLEKDPEVRELERRLDNEKNKTYEMEEEAKIKRANLMVEYTAETRTQSQKFMMKAGIEKDLNKMQASMEAYLKTFPNEIDETSDTRDIKELRALILDQWRSIHYLNLEIRKLTLKPNPQLPPIRPQSR